MNKRVGKIAITAGACTAGLAICELVLAFAFPHKPAPPRVLLHRKSAVPGLSYELAPGLEARFEGVRVATNSLGMRDDEPASDENVYRIAAVGDSFTFGWAVESCHAYPAVLERLLNESCHGARRYDVLNFGVSGYNTRDEALAVRYKALPLGPRWIVIGYVLNDPLMGQHALHAYFAPASLWKRSNLVRLIGDASRRFERLRLGRGDAYIYLHSSNQTSWQNVVAAFRSIAADASRVKAQVCLAIFPVLDASRTRSWAEYPYHALHRQVAAAASDAAFRVVDLAVPFSQHPPSALRVSDTDHHPSRLAHRLAAEALREALSPGCGGPR